METINKCWQEYRQVISENPFLSKKEEAGLSAFVRRRKDGKIKSEARDKLFLANLRLVLNIAHTYNYNGHDFLDLVAAGSEGLTIAIDRFNPRKFKTRLSTYAVPWIKLKITEYLTNNNSAVYIPAHLIEKGRKYENFKKTLDKKDHSLTDKELMDKLNVSEKGLKRLKLSSQVRAISMDAPIEESERTIKDVIEDNKPTSDEICLENNNKEVMMAVLSELSPIEQAVISCRYLTGDKEKLASVGKKYGVTGERIRQIEFKALRRMRKKLKSQFSFAK